MNAHVYVFSTPINEYISVLNINESVDADNAGVLDFVRPPGAEETFGLTGVVIR